MDDIKVIITSRENNLKAYKDYTKFFAPNNDRSKLIEYKIDDIDSNQIRQYVKKMRQEGEDDSKEPNSEQIWEMSEDKLVSKVLKFKDVIISPYMMKIVIDILPSLDQIMESKTFSDGLNADISLELVYKTSTKKLF